MSGQEKPLEETTSTVAHGWSTYTRMTNKMNANTLVLPVEEAAAALSVSRGTVYNLINRGRLKVVKIGRSTRITTESIRALVETAKGAA